jgi:hypothetical protein
MLARVTHSPPSFSLYVTMTVGIMLYLNLNSSAASPSTTVDFLALARTCTVAAPENGNSFGALACGAAVKTALCSVAKAFFRSSFIWAKPPLYSTPSMSSS